jgi:PAS domain-containing protein
MLRQARLTSDFAQAARTADRVLGWPVQRDRRTLRGADDARPALSRVLAAHAVDGEAVDAMIERLPVGVAVTDRNGALVYANAAARALPLADFPELQTMVAQALLTGEEIAEGQRAYLGPDRSRHWLTVTVAPARGADGRLVAAAITLVDVTTHIQASEWRPIIDSLVTL